MLHRIRLAMQNRTIMKLGGSGKEVEVDETFIGGKARNMHADVHKRRIFMNRMRDKTPVMGILERGGEVRAVVIPNCRRKHIEPRIHNNVHRKTTLYTDALLSYQGLKHQDYIHEVIDHAECYVKGRVHTNGMENFWSLLKRGLRGTYVSVEPFHLFRYLDEQVFRYNFRKLAHDGHRFVHVLSRIFGKRLTYADVTGKLATT
jgi:transposase-like protein